MYLVLGTAEIQRDRERQKKRDYQCHLFSAMNRFSTRSNYRARSTSRPAMIINLPKMTINTIKEDATKLKFKRIVPCLLGFQLTNWQEMKFIFMALENMYLQRIFLQHWSVLKDKILWKKKAKKKKCCKNTEFMEFVL